MITDQQQLKISLSLCYILITFSVDQLINEALMDCQWIQLMGHCAELWKRADSLVSQLTENLVVWMLWWTGGQRGWSAHPAWGYTGSCDALCLLAPVDHGQHFIFLCWPLSITTFKQPGGVNVGADECLLKTCCSLDMIIWFFSGFFYGINWLFSRFNNKKQFTK